MRPYIPAIVVVVVFVALLGAGFVTSSVFQAPQNSFRSEADRKIEEAQRMLRDYEGGHPRLMAAIEALEKLPPDTQPSSDAVPQTPSEERDVAGGIARDIDSRREELNGRVKGLSGSEREGAPGGFSSREDLKAQVEANSQLLKKALELVQGVITSSSSGEEAIRGDTLPVATRLEAILLYHQADLERRRAAVQQSIAQAEKATFDTLTDSWRKTRASVNALKLELAGMKGGDLKLAAPAQSPAGDDASGTASAPATADAQPEATPASPDASTVTVSAVASLEERVKDLQAQGQKTDEAIAETQKEADRLTGLLNGLRDRLKKAKSDAEASEKRMMELEDLGLVSGDPDALEKFTRQYNEQAKKNRESSREAAGLELGVIRNARPDTDDESEVAAAPLVEIKQGQPMSPEMGIVRLEADLRATKGLLESRQNLRKLISGQVEALQKQGKNTQERLAKAQERLDAIAKEAAASARLVTAAAIRAEQYQDEAIGILTGDAKAAAERAASAAREHSSSVQTFYQKNVPTAPSPQLNFVGGHAQALAGDVQFQLALIYTQRVSLLSEQQQLLVDAQATGIAPATLQTAQTEGDAAAGENPAKTGTPTTQPQGIAQAIQEARTKAIEAGTAALEAYKNADDALNRLWGLHTQMAAVHYLLTSVATGNDAQKHQAEALREYKAALADRGDQPEIHGFRPMIDALTQASQPK